MNPTETTVNDQPDTIESASPAVRDLLAELFRRLDEAAVSYCVLRNYEGLPEHVGNDVDLLVHSRHVSAFHTCLTDAAHAGDWQFLGGPKRFGWRSYRLAHRRTNELIHLDVMDRLTWKGVRWADESAVLENRRRWRGFFVPDASCEAGVLLLKDLIQGSPIRPKYHGRIRDSAQSDAAALQAFLAWSLGRRLAGWLCDQAGKGAWASMEARGGAIRRAVLARAFRRSPIGPLAHYACFLWGHLWSCVARPSGIFVVLIGPDGSGKSTVASAMMESLEPLFVLRRYYHAHFEILPELKAIRNRILRVAGRRPPATAPRSPSAQDYEPYSFWRAMTYILYYVLDFLLGHFVMVRARGRGDLVVFDRYFYDYWIQRSFERVPAGFLRVLMRVIPRPDLVIWLENEPEVIHERKPELRVPEIEWQLARCKRLMKWMRSGVAISTHADPAVVSARACKAVIDTMRLRHTTVGSRTR